ncbi:uncharacterized protein KGF55_000256 [Candida pseudojiufengensis]|uniref:uncharacterized protein n=1 Tax=Candida pseudojiufengensis TaxID=497109 RepID=UPI002224E2C0|nr:uncharacterized protein KGF55_000256 [Candida pseudojiufengensis]KAI5966847.1 hypothetical protein KGF55_000256 [Candida pseudojiufengensis]
MFSRNLSRSIQRSSIYNSKRQFSLTDWFKSWQNAAQTQRLIYPPSPTQFTTNNRIIDVWVDQKQDLYNYINVKPPLLLNFTTATPENNKITQELFDLLVDKSKYPGKEPVYLVNILADSQGGRELMLEYVVNKIPTIVVLKHQLFVGSYSPNVKNFHEQDLIDFLKDI